MKKQNLLLLAVFALTVAISGQIYAGASTTGTVTANAFVGNGALLTNLTATNLTGTIAPARLSGSYDITVSTANYASLLNGLSDTAFLKVSNNLSDLNNVSTARTNLGLGSLALQSASSVSITGGTITGVTIEGTITTANVVLDPNVAVKNANNNFSASQTVTGTVSATDVQAADSGALRLGPDSTSGSWRFAIVSGDLVIQKYVSGSWVTKFTITE